MGGGEAKRVSTGGVHPEKYLLYSDSVRRCGVIRHRGKERRNQIADMGHANSNARE